MCCTTMVQFLTGMNKEVEIYKEVENDHVRSFQTPCAIFGHAEKL